MEDPLIKILDRLGIVKAIWVYNTNGRRVLTTLRTNQYGYVANISPTFSLALNTDGTVRNRFNLGYTHWNYYMPSSDESTDDSE